MSRRFARIQSGLDVTPLLRELSEHPDPWSVDAHRQTNVEVQRETESVMICGHAASESFREAREKRPLRYVGRPTELSSSFPDTLDFVQRLARRAHGVPGRAVLVRLRPRGRVYEHVDRGLYYQLRSRYHLVLKSALGSPLRAGPEVVRMREGELWWFDNRLPHEAWNESDEDRIHLIVDLLSPGSVAAFPLRMIRRPGLSAKQLGRRLRRR